MKKISLGLVLLLSCLLITVSLSAVAEERGSKYGGTLVQALREEPDNLNPQVTTRAFSFMIFTHVMEPLLVHNDDLELEGLLAEDWESENNKEWFVHLKEGVEFHNGEELTAEAVEFTYSDEMFLSDSNPNNWVLENLKEVEAVDKYTAKFVLKKKSPLFPQHLADGYTAIFPPKATEEYGDNFGTETLIGTGPYQLEEWKHGEEIVLSRYEDYDHGPDFLRSGPAYIEEKIFRVIPEATTRVESLIAGDVDLELSFDPKFATRLENANDVRVEIKPDYGVQFMHFNQDTEILQDKKVRRSIAHTVNKEAILEAAWDGIGFVAKGLFPSATVGYDPAVKEAAYEFDPEKGEELLEEAGWVDEDGDGVREKDGEKLELNLITFANLDQWATAGEMIKPMLEDIGFSINLNTYEVGAAYDIIEGGEEEYDIGITKILWNLGPGYLDLLCKSGRSLNYPGYSNEELDQLIETAQLGETQEEREEALLEAHKMAIDTAVWVPLVIRTQRMAVGQRIGGVDDLLKHPWTSEIPQALRLYVEN
ncbi:MAG: ABC transporter substrate-binding protein [Candidatus Bipolaricaulota bacterium]